MVAHRAGFRVIVLFLLWLVFGQLPLEARPKNVVMIVADDHGLNLGCYGDRQAKTPHLDRLASEGTRFTRAFCTTASCSASRSVILSGLHNHANGQFGHAHFPHNFFTHSFVKSMPGLLRDAGYRTALIGKFHVQPDSVYSFDVELKGNVGGPRNPVTMAEKCRSFFASDTNRPFFLYFCTTDPHRSRLNDAKPFQYDRFGNDIEPSPPAEFKFDPAKIEVPSFLPDLPETRTELAEYYQSVARVDRGVGKLVEVLKETGQYDNTLILYLSDNGMAFPGSKTTLYEPGMRLPLIVRGPDQARRGVVSDAMVSWVDLLPTVLEFTGAKGPAKYPLHGRSFLKELERENSPERDEIYASHTFHEVTMYYPMRVVRTHRYKLFLNLAHWLPYPFASDLQESATWQGFLRSGNEVYGKRPVNRFLQRPRWELYDLEKDPDEAVNLAEDPQMAAVLQELQAKLRQWQKKTADPWLLKYEYE